MLADEMTSDLRAIRSQAVTSARQIGRPVTLALVTKGVSFGSITANPDGSKDTSQVQGVDPDLRIRPFFAQGGTISIREFIVGALNAEMGLQTMDPDLATASAGGRVVTPSGMVLDGSLDKVEAPPGPDQITGAYEIDPALVDHLEFYLLNYFKPGTYQQDARARRGLKVFNQLGCSSCHVQNLTINRDRRVADINTVYDPEKGIFNTLFATAVKLAHPDPNDRNPVPLQLPNLQPFVVQNIFTDFKRHDLGPNFHERNWDGTPDHKLFLTRPLWGVGSLGSLGHDGRSISLTEVILRHGGEAQAARDAFANLYSQNQQSGDSGDASDLLHFNQNQQSGGSGDASDLLHFLSTLVLFPPDDTASTLDAGNRNDPDFPQSGHGSIKLTVLFNNPADKE
jgi:hypothetical protein